MTSKTLLFFAVILCSISSFAQGNSATAIPSQVSQSLMTLFPAATNITWEMDRGYYVPSFKNNSVATKALIDQKGTLIQSEIKLDRTALPQTAKDYISNHFPGIETKETATVTTMNGKKRIRASVGSKTLIFEVTGAYLSEAPTPVIY
jgi:hypothetical protein